MKKIAILTCLKACRVCTGAGCLEAWNTRTRHFAQYAGREVQLAAFLHCNGCDSDNLADPGMQEKLERLQTIGVETVHLGICTRTEQPDGSLCPRVAAIVRELNARGIQTQEGTH